MSLALERRRVSFSKFAVERQARSSESTSPASENNDSTGVVVAVREETLRVIKGVQKVRAVTLLWELEIISFNNIS
jgi:hypothetical protein